MNNHEKRLYLENSRSQQLMLLFIIGNTAFTIFQVNNMDVDAQLGVFVMTNIFLSLLALLTAVRQKMYTIRWAYVGIALAVFQFARLFWIPEEITNPLRFYLIVLLVATAISAFVGALICIKRTRERQNFIIENNIELAILQK